MKKKEEEEIYKNFMESMLSNHASKNNIPLTKNPIPNPISEDVKSKPSSNIKNTIEPLRIEKKVQKQPISISDIQIDISKLPMSFMYDSDAIINIRPLTTREIQIYSEFNNLNIFEFRNKMDEILEQCTDIDIKNIQDNDRLYLLYYIREISIPYNISVDISYLENDITYHDTIDLIKENIEIYDFEKSGLKEFFDYQDKVFMFELEFGKIIIAPPTIGLKQCFDQYMLSIDKSLLKESTPFFKYAIYLKPNVNYMSMEDLDKFKGWFESDMNKNSFFFLKDLIDNHFRLGVRGLKIDIADKIIRTTQIYPKKPETFFTIPNAFSKFVLNLTK